jgi:adenine-specific DNA-methyltransferase
LELPPKPEFDVIIENPPYVRWMNIPEAIKNMLKKSQYWKKIMNSLCDLTYAFIYHSVNLLKARGELIFICPIFWIETVHGKNLREYLCENGSVELLINFNEAKIFSARARRHFAFTVPLSISSLFL